MSVTNPERVVTKQDLADFYEGIFPYLGGNAEAGFTPIGTIIAVMGNSAPTNYLACKGQIVNIADYPELANYFKAQFGSYNYFGGDGTTTFGIPDLRGEFLRGTGSNGHTGQGGGSSVGTHQNSTQIPVYALDSSILGIFDNGTYNYPKNPDAVIDRTNSRKNFSSSGTTSVSSIESTVTVRPTNTSVLYCIATKNIYMNPELDYSTEEKVIGSWIDGKPLYQKTIYIETLPTPSSSDNYMNGYTIPHNINNLDKIVRQSGQLLQNYSGTPAFRPISYTYFASEYSSDYVATKQLSTCALVSNANIKLYLGTGLIAAFTGFIYIIQYTKTTD